MHEKRPQLQKLQGSRKQLIRRWCFGYFGYCTWMLILVTWFVHGCLFWLLYMYMDAYFDQWMYGKMFCFFWFMYAYFGYCTWMIILLIVRYGYSVFGSFSFVTKKQNNILSSNNTKGNFVIKQYKRKQNNILSQNNILLQRSKTIWQILHLNTD